MRVAAKCAEICINTAAPGLMLVCVVRHRKIFEFYKKLVRFHIGSADTYELTGGKFVGSGSSACFPPFLRLVFLNCKAHLKL